MLRQREDNMEVTSLCVRLLVNVLLLLAARGQNSFYAQRSDGAFLHVKPNRLQFFEYESISLKCDGFHSPAEWRVMKRLTTNTTQWGTSTRSLDIKPAFVAHSGEYWCENEDGERSSTVNITVTGGNVILESPAVPVVEGGAVALRCRKKGGSSTLAADFYKNGSFIKTEYTGSMNISNLNFTDEGLYRCSISGSGASPQSRLSVTACVTPTPQERTTQQGQESPQDPPHPGSVQLYILLSVVFSVVCVAVLLLVFGLLHCRKRRADPRMATYANVRKPKKTRGCREADASDVTYSTVTTRTRRAPTEANVSDPKSMYAVVTPRKDRGR